MGWFADHFFGVYSTQILVLSLVIPNVLELGILVLLILWNRTCNFLPTRAMFTNIITDARNTIIELKGALLLPILLGIESIIICALCFSKELTIIVSCILVPSLLSILYYYPSFKQLKYEFTKYEIINTIRNILAIGCFVNMLLMLIVCAVNWSAQLKDLFTEGEWPQLDAPVIQITIEYYMLGILHIFQALCRLDLTNNKKRIPHVLFHIGVAVMAFYVQTKYQSTRFHHDFLGILLMAIPLRPFQLVGFLYLVDSMCNDYSSTRTGNFDNLVVNNFSLMFPLILLACFFELCTKYVLYKVKTSDNAPNVSFKYFVELFKKYILCRNIVPHDYVQINNIDNIDNIDNTDNIENTNNTNNTDVLIV